MTKDIFNIENALKAEKNTISNSENGLRFKNIDSQLLYLPILRMCGVLFFKFFMVCGID